MGKRRDLNPSFLILNKTAMNEYREKLKIEIAEIDQSINSLSLEPFVVSTLLSKRSTLLTLIDFINVFY